MIQFDAFMSSSSLAQYATAKMWTLDLKILVSRGMWIVSFFLPDVLLKKPSRWDAKHHVW